MSATEVMVMPREPFDKMAWQRAQRRAFAAEHGYSTAANYGAGGLRERVLERDGRKCVKCGMTDEQHKVTFSRPITIDHKNRDRSENTMGNLQTLCLPCHGKKDLSPSLCGQRIPLHRETIMRLRADGNSYQAIANSLGFSIGGIFKWAKRWEAK